MTDARLILRNIAARVAGEGGSRLLTALTFLILARLMGARDLGAFLAALSFASVFVVLHDVGFSLVLAREIARFPKSAAALARRVLILKAAAATLLCAAAPLAARLADLPENVRLLVGLAAVAVTTTSFVDLLGAVLLGLERLDLDAGLRIGHRLLLLAGPVAGWSVTRTPGGALAGQLAASAVVFAASITWFLRLKGNGRPVLPRGALLREIWPLTLASTLIIVSFRIDMMLLPRFRSLEEVGWYGAAHRCLEMGLTIPSILATVLFPRLVRLADTGRRGRRQPEIAAHRAAVYGRLARYFLLMGLPAGAIMTMTAGWFVPLMLGHRFAPAAPFATILGPALACSFVGNYFAYAIVASNLTWSYVATAAIACACSVIGNLLVMPAHGGVGAAWMTVGTEAVELLGRGVVFLLFIAPLEAGPLLRTLLAFLPVGILLWLGASHPLAQVVALSCYVPATVLTGAVGREDWSFLRSSLGRFAGSPLRPAAR